MEFLAIDDQGIADLTPDDEEDDFLIHNIIQDSKVAYSEFELGGRRRAPERAGPTGYVGSHAGGQVVSSAPASG
jgi:hypothetical protein